MAHHDPLPSYTPQSISDILPIYRPDNSDGHIQIYTLRQPSTNTQTLVPRDTGSNGEGAQYTIKTFKTGGFMNKKPHVIISRNAQTPPLIPNITSARRFSVVPQATSRPGVTSESQAKIAEGRFDNNGTGTTITYLPPSSATNAPQRDQHLTLESSQKQSICTLIATSPHWWQPFPGNKAVLELTNAADELVARFIYSSAQPGAGMGFKKEVEVGELQIVEALLDNGEGGDSRARAVEEVVCSAIVIVERARRRAANIGSLGLGGTQGLACGITRGELGSGGGGC